MEKTMVVNTQTKVYIILIALGLIFIGVYEVIFTKSILYLGDWTDSKTLIGLSSLALGIVGATFFTAFVIWVYRFFNKRKQRQ